MLQVLVLGVLAGAWVATTPAAHDPVTTTVTFEREVRAILQARCGACHAPGAPAPMPLTTYEDVRPWARAIKEQVLTRRMPVWHAAHGYGAYANDPSLTPAEIAAIAAWVDGGQPRTPGSSPSSPSAAPAPVHPVIAAFRRKAPVALAIPAGRSDARLAVPSSWIAAWDFEPGDPLITSATFTSAGGAVIGTWVAGDVPVVLPDAAAVRVASPIRVRIERRAPADYEKPFTRRRSVLRIVPLTDAPPRRVWTERTPCGVPRTGRAADLLAVRPVLAAGASARIWLERPGAPRTIVGWFRDADARYLRTYWLARPADLPPESRVQSEAACTIDLTLASR